MNVVEIHYEDGGYVAVDSETGIEGRGETKAHALVALGTELRNGGTEAASSRTDLADVTDGLLDGEDLLEGNFYTQEDVEDIVEQ